MSDTIDPKAVTAELLRGQLREVVDAWPRMLSEVERYVGAGNPAEGGLHAAVFSATAGQLSLQLFESRELADAELIFQARELSRAAFEIAKRYAPAGLAAIDVTPPKPAPGN